jgi:hypothetical protein
MDVSIVIVNYNQKNLLNVCLFQAEILLASAFLSKILEGYDIILKMVPHSQFTDKVKVASSS